jgi:hypothetical protein
MKCTALKLSALVFALGTTSAVSLAGVSTTTVDFNDGMNHGWEGPQGFGGVSYVDPTGGVGGTGGYRTEFNDFGIDFANNTNAAFLGDYTQYDEVTVSFDLAIDQIGFAGLGITRPIMLELRSYDLGDPGYPWASAYVLFDWYGADSFSGFQNFSVTIDTTATDLPAGWGGNGSFHPDTFGAQLPDGVTFADILANVDEIAISTFLPDFFFTNDDYDMTLDNISISTVPAPTSFALIALGGMVGTRRRR